MKYKPHKLSEIEEHIKLAIKHAEKCEELDILRGIGIRYPKITDMTRRISYVMEVELQHIFEKLGYITAINVNGKQEGLNFALNEAFGEIKKELEIK